nr:MAG TPA: hypothetical protein [Caudoviricetes sp.]DAG20260.1 MAG TPA: hypothetical protein [Caudoviricetes sp.]
MKPLHLGRTTTPERRGHPPWLNAVAMRKRQ